MAVFCIHLCRALGAALLVVAVFALTLPPPCIEAGHDGAGYSPPEVRGRGADPIRHRLSNAFES
jgi:hypothetical protein